MGNQLERWQALLVEQARECELPERVVWLYAQLTRVAFMIANAPPEA